MTKSIETHETDWTTLLLTCGKCARKLDGGFGHKGRETLRACLRGALKDAGRRHQTRLVETRCLGICPKHAVVALNAGRPGTLVILKQGTQATEALQAPLPGVNAVNDSDARDINHVHATEAGAVAAPRRRPFQSPTRCAA